MRDYPEEKFLLQSIADTLMGYDAICTFNGRTFDVPLLRDRFLMNRMDDSCLDKPHIDLLHIARRVFKLRLQRCNLGKLEEAVLGIPRFDDLPGAQVPQRFFDYLKTGKFDLLTDVLEHNAQDVASLCVLLTAMVEMYRAPENVRHDEDVFSMGVALERFQHVQEARKCYQLTSGNLHAQGQERLAQEVRALLRSGAVQHGAVFTQKAHLVRHGGEQRAHGVVLPAGGGTEQDIPLPQAADQGKQPLGHDGLVIGQQRAVDIGCNETDHKTLLLGIRMENGEKRPRQGASFPTAPGRGTGADLLHAQRALRDHPAVPTTE